MKVGDPIPTMIDLSDKSIALVSPDKGATLFHVWSISCPACKANMPHLQQLRDDYASHGLQTVAIHMPRGEAELDETKVRTIADEIGVVETLLYDNDHKISEAFGVNAVPAYFLFSSEGKLRRHALGNFGVRMIGEAVKRLFGDSE